MARGQKKLNKRIVLGMVAQRPKVLDRQEAPVCTVIEVLDTGAGFQRERKEHISRQVIFIFAY